MKMRDHKIRGRELPFEWGRGEHDSRQTRDQELEQERNAEKHGRFELNLASPHRPDPIEDFDSSGNADNHCGDHEETVSIRTHPNGEHMVGPDAHADESNADRRGDHHRISEDRLAGENRNDFRNEGESRNDQYVDFRVTENPEEVHPENGGASCLRVKEMPAKVT